MSKKRLGGVKAFAKRAYLTSWCRSGENVLGDICFRLSEDRINLNLLTHITDTGMHRSVTAASVENTEAFSSYIHWKSSQGQCSIGKLVSDVSAVSVFPHDQKLDVIGSLIVTLAGTGIRPYGFASSPSAMTMLIPSSELESIISGLFDTFEFPAYSSPLDWHAAYRGQEALLNQIICSYQEEVIKVYNLTRLCGLDLWKISLPPKNLGDLGSVFEELHKLSLTMPFLVSKSSPDAETLCFAFCLAASCHEAIRTILHRCFPEADLFCHGPASVFFLHGPHFGDRYGIANACVRSLGNAGITPLAMSCAVSSVSIVVDDKDSDQSIEALGSSFCIPPRKP